MTTEKSPPAPQCRGATKWATSTQPDNTGQHEQSPPEDVAVQLRRRRDASQRLPPLRDGRHDPWLPTPQPRMPSDYGLTLDELRAHANTLHAAWAWDLEEICAVLALKPKDRP